MFIARIGPWFTGLVIVVIAAIVGVSCGGGGGGGETALPLIVATSFNGFPGAPNGGPPPVFRNEVLLVTFNLPLDTDIFGGFVLEAGTSTPATFLGFAPGQQGVPYFAFVDQSAAAQSLQVMRDFDARPHTGILGVSANDPRTLVFDPRVPFEGPLGLPGTFGFDPTIQYDILIPSGNGLRFGGLPAPPFGSRPRVPLPPFNPSPPPSRLLVTAVGFAPDTVPPVVQSIESDQRDPVSGTIPHDATITVKFSEAIDAASVDRLTNIVVRNRSIPTTADPEGALVPTTQTSNSARTEFYFTPTTTFGDGPFEIEVSVGANADARDDIRDLPAGLAGTQNSLGNSLTVTFTTEAAPGRRPGLAVRETFATKDQEDTSFTPRYHLAKWDRAGPGDDPTGELRGKPITGVPDQGPGGLGVGEGARSQITITPTNGIPVGPPPPPCTTPTCTYFSPFDDSCPNGVGCPATGPFNNTPQSLGGGGRVQLMYQMGTPFGELPAGFANSIELLEWQSPPAAGAFAFTFAGFSMKMGHTSAGTTTTGEALTRSWETHWTFDNPQNEFISPPFHPDPANPNLNEAPVLVYAPGPYVVGGPVCSPGSGTLSGFIPFPCLDMPFDFDGNRMEIDNPAVGAGTPVAPSLLIDLRVAAGTGFNGNVIVGSNAAAAIPIRRVFGGPDAAAAFSIDAVFYHVRITTVDKNSSMLTKFYDVGAVGSPEYLGLDVVPALDLQPLGTFTTVRVEAADSGSSTSPLNPTGLRTYILRSGVAQESALDALDGHRFFRVQFEFESNVRANTTPAITGFLAGYSL